MSLVVLLSAGAAWAQAVPATEQARPTSEGPPPEQQDSTGVATATGEENVADILVTARRQTESVQNVPQTVNAISSETIKKLQITQFQDVAAVVPGLTLNQGSVTAGRTPAPSIRGVSFDASTQASPTVDIYLNEVPIGATNAFQAIYDVGGIEVLRGPQGTLRGRTAPSGAILISTRKADVSEIGGYGSVLSSNLNAVNGQAAINLPIVTDMLALRVAGLADRNEADTVRSLNSTADPSRRTLSGRASLAFEPTSALRANLVYQYLDNRSSVFTAVAGPGALGGVTATAPRNYNGPALDASDRRGVDDAPRDTRLKSHQVTASIDWDVASHTVSYVGGYNRDRNRTFSALDYGNALVGSTYYQDITTRTELFTQELRVASRNEGGLFDYVLGYFHSESKTRAEGQQPATFLPGAFGPPNASSPFLFNPKFSLNALISVRSQSEENSFFGNATLRFGQGTELSGGLRYIVSSTDDRQIIRLSNGFISTRIPAPCALARFDSTYPPFCDVPIAAQARPIQDSTRDERDEPIVYSASIRHRFSEQVLAYANTGSSWRRGAVNTTVQNFENDPVLASFTFLPNEKSQSYEVGVKTNWWQRRVRANLAVFYQRFQNLQFQLPGIPLVQNDGSGNYVNIGTLNVAADAIVKGFDFDTAVQATDNWTIGLQISYADGQVDDQLIPCADGNFDGVPDTILPTLAGFQAAGTRASFCRSSQSVSRDPIWNATMQSELNLPVSDTAEGYLRGLWNVYPHNPRANPGFVADSYGLLNLFAGLRSSDGAWDVGVFARNVTNTGEQLTREPTFLIPPQRTDNFFGSTGYRYVSFTRPREVGVSVRYSFGSR